jgi:hypothetical protein
MTSLLTLVLLAAEEEAPPARDVVAGWGAFGLFLAGIVVVVLLWFSMRKQIRRVDENRDKGVFDEQPSSTDAGGDADQS